MIAGMFAGSANSNVVGPIELVKCRLQLQYEDSSKAYYKGPIHCLRTIVAEEGIRGLFKGMVST